MSTAPDSDRERDDEQGEERVADERIEKVEEHITEARNNAEEALRGPFADENARLYVESGDDEAERDDDQTAQPM